MIRLLLSSIPVNNICSVENNIAGIWGLFLRDKGQTQVKTA